MGGRLQNIARTFLNLVPVGGNVLVHHMPLLSIPAVGDWPVHVHEADSPAEIEEAGSNPDNQAVHCRICFVQHKKNSRPCGLRFVLAPALPTLISRRVEQIERQSNPPSRPCPIYSPPWSNAAWEGAASQTACFSDQHRRLVLFQLCDFATPSHQLFEERHDEDGLLSIDSRKT